MRFNREIKSAFVDTIDDNYIKVRCPDCGMINTYTRNSTDEGYYIQQCKKCDTRFSYRVDKHEIFGGGESGRR
jgi:phage FluMu protein Com